MGSVTPTVVPGEGYVRVEVNWQDFPHARRCWIWRTVAGVDTLLRDGDYVPLSNGIAVAFDHEAPLDTVITYKSTIPLNYNGDFETGVTEWTDTTGTLGTLGTISQSLDYYAPGAGNASMKLTPTGVAQCRATSEYLPATAGTSYTFSAQLMLPSYWAGGVGLAIAWYNGTTFLSSFGGATNLTPAEGVWESYSQTATAPATTTQARLLVLIEGSAPSVFPVLVDEAYMTTAAGTVTSSAVVVPSNGNGWWTDPLHPATKVRLQADLYVVGCNGPAGVAYLGVGEEQFPADSVIMEVNDAEYPVAAFQRRKSGRQLMRVGTATLTDLVSVRALHASGAPLFLQLTADYGETDAYQLHGDLTVPRVNGDQRVPWRLAQSEFVKVLPPVGPAEGTLDTRYVDMTKYATFAAATSAGATWLDVLRGLAAV